MRQLTVLLFLLGPGLLPASTGAAFLKIPVGPRVCGTGEAAVAYIDDASALFYNPAGLASVQTFDVLLAHNQWLLDMNHEYVAGAYGYEGLGVFGLANTRLPVGRSGLQLLAPALLPLVPKLKVKGLCEDDRFFLYFALQAMRRGELLIYAPTVPAEIHARLPFVLFMGSPEAALARARRRFPRSAKVAIFPHGGSTFPICPEGDHD